MYSIAIPVYDLCMSETNWRIVISARLRTARIAAGYSIRDAAEAAGLTKATIQRSERGNQDTGSETVCRLCEVYGIPPAVIFAEPATLSPVNPKAE